MAPLSAHSASSAPTTIMVPPWWASSTWFRLWRMRLDDAVGHHALEVVEQRVDRVGAGRVAEHAERQQQHRRDHQEQVERDRLGEVGGVVRARTARSPAAPPARGRACSAGAVRLLASLLRGSPLTAVVAPGHPWIVDSPRATAATVGRPGFGRRSAREPARPWTARILTVQDADSMDEALDRASGSGSVSPRWTAYLRRQAAFEDYYAAPRTSPRCRRRRPPTH